MAMEKPTRVGFDFDNTIVEYNDVLCTVAKNHGLLDSNFVGGKRSARDAIWLLPDGEIAWQRLQGQEYGKEIGGGRLIDGVEKFLRRCRAEGCGVVVVSHKTEYGRHDLDRMNLRKATLRRMAANGLFEGESAVSVGNIYFEDTRAKKLVRTASLSLTHFIDGLEEVLADLSFPPSVKRILFAGVEPTATTPYTICSTWHDIEEAAFETS